jgi:hypothetical protein
MGVSGQHHAPAALYPRINTAPILDVLSTGILSQIEKSFVNEKRGFWVKNTVTYCPQQPVTQMRSFL